MIARRTRVPILLALLFSAPATVHAQQRRVTLSGRGELETDSILKRVVASGNYRLLDADTVYAPGDTIQGPVIFAATTAKLENVILGDVVIVDANVFLRPHAHIAGDVVNIGGGLFLADNALIDGTVRQYREASYRAERRSDGVRITGTRVSSLLDLDGLKGFHAPTYDRVSGITVAWGARYLLPRAGATEPDAHGWIGYETSRKTLIGGAELGVRHGAFHVGAGGERDVITHDAWARGWSNTVSYALRGHDYRNYYEADRYYLGPDLSYMRDDQRITLRLLGQVEDAHSIPALDPWHAFGNPARPNPVIDDGRISSLALSFKGEWERATWAAELEGEVEAAGTWLQGTRSFNRFDAGAHWAMQAIADHTFVMKMRFRGPLPGTDSLPHQRWNAIGGRPTLPRLNEAELYGDRLAYVESEYRVPFPRALTTRVFGRPAIEALHRVGNAWSKGGDSSLFQNVGVRLRVRIFYVLAVADPSRLNRGILLSGLSIPHRYPWMPID